jgi:hypothetical protein
VSRTGSWPNWIRSTAASTLTAASTPTPASTSTTPSTCSPTAPTSTPAATTPTGGYATKPFTKLYIDEDGDLRVEHARPFDMLLDPASKPTPAWANGAHGAKRRGPNLAQ